MIDIIISSFRRSHYLEALVKAIKERTVFPHKVIVVDNCSIPETRDFTEGLKKEGYIDEVIHNEKNYPLSQVYKLGLELVESEYCVLALDDLLPPRSNPCWLTHLDFLIRNEPEYGAISIRYRKCNFDKYFKETNKIKDIPLKTGYIDEKRSIEEVFHIVKTSELKKIGFTTRNVGQYHFASSMKELFNKKVGITMASYGMRCITWRDENAGYKETIPERFNFEL